jgi:hypothetical protein
MLTERAKSTFYDFINIDGFVKSLLRMEPEPV